MGALCTVPKSRPVQVSARLSPSSTPRTVPVHPVLLGPVPTRVLTLRVGSTALAGVGGRTWFIGDPWEGYDSLEGPRSPYSLGGSTGGRGQRH